MVVFAVLFPFFLKKYIEPKINGWLRTQVRSTGAPRYFARQVFDKAFLRGASGVIVPLGARDLS